MSDRDAFQEARTAGLRARHETREARAIRKQVADEIAAACLDQWIAHDGNPDDFIKGWNGGVVNLAAIAREIGAQE